MPEEKRYVTNFTFPNGETFYVKDENTYTKTEIDNKIDGSGSGDTNVQSDWNQTDSTADDYIKNKPDIYTKNEIDNKLVSVMTYKGTKATASELPNSGNQQGDVWHINADGSEWAWNGSSWEELGKNNINYVTPEQFGAVGDGVTDDTVALQTAVRAGNVVCEAGKTYLISKPIIVAEHIYDFGGCTIKMADGYEINRVDIDGVSYGYLGLVFDDLDGFCVKNLTLDCNKAGNASTAITGAIFSDSTGTFENCTFQNATYKHLVINRGNNLHFYDTTLKNLGTAANCSDVYVSGTPESDVVFNGVTAVRESGNTSTGQVFYINTGNVAVSDADIENCHIFTDSRSGNTTVRDAVVYNAKNLAFIDQDSSRANPANITYENVRFYELERTSNGYGMQVGGVGSLTIDNMYVQFASTSTFSHAVYFQSNYGKLNRNIRINGLRMDLGSVALQNALYFSGDDTTENVLLTDCHFALASMTRAYIARIANNPKNVRIENCTFDNFQSQWVYGNTNQHLLGVSNATPRRAATADLPTLTTADTGSIIYDTTLGIFKLWNGSAWIDPRPSVPAIATDSNMTDWTTGKTVDAATMKTVVTAAGLKVSTLEDDVNALENAGYQTASDVQTAIATALSDFVNVAEEGY